MRFFTWPHLLSIKPGGAVTLAGLFICPPKGSVTGCTMPPRRRAYFNILTLKKQDENDIPPKKLQAAEHLRTRRPENMINRDPSRAGLAPYAAYFTQPRPLVNTKSTSNIKNQELFTFCKKIRRLTLSNRRTHKMKPGPLPGRACTLRRLFYSTTPACQYKFNIKH